ncbi:hypothetical protein Ccrd_002144 [Cynara cardunculus var. scolymus]|uniref:S-acyltransferase n=1 Tax=Cynara cardunculus var. scolymus TaxID=59895 RepID=A0A118JXN9_CYNCS|nr:hypothetical protein Ccrd_002144 [Cynara cardunculus var. scolymus]
MDLTDSAPSIRPSSDSIPLPSGSAPRQEDHYVASIIEEHETTCWGCGLRLVISPYAPIFKCGWCGAITNHNARKFNNKYFWLRRLRDRSFVSILLLFMLFIIGSGVWAIYPVIVSMSYFFGIFHSIMIGNCVGAGNHRSFILFLMSAVASTFYVSIISSYVAYQIWPPLRHIPTAVLSRSTVVSVLTERTFAFLISVEYLPIRGFVLIYLFFASISVEIGLAVLLWQQLCYIYEGKTYLSQLSSHNDVDEKDCQNIVRFFGFPYPATRYVLSIWNSKKSHKK